MTEVLTGAQILCRALLEEGVDVLFGYPGGAIMPFYHALPEFPGLRHGRIRRLVSFDGRPAEPGA